MRLVQSKRLMRKLVSSFSGRKDRPDCGRSSRGSGNSSSSSISELPHWMLLSSDGSNWRSTQSVAQFSGQLGFQHLEVQGHDRDFHGLLVDIHAVDAVGQQGGAEVRGEIPAAFLVLEGDFGLLLAPLGPGPSDSAGTTALATDGSA